MRVPRQAVHRCMLPRHRAPLVQSLVASQAAAHPQENPARYCCLCAVLLMRATHKAGYQPGNCAPQACCQRHGRRSAALHLGRAG